MFIYERVHLCPSNHPDQSSDETKAQQVHPFAHNMKSLKTCFSFFWQINQTSATAQHMERLAVETNMIACHAVALVCKQELVLFVSAGLCFGAQLRVSRVLLVFTQMCCFELTDVFLGLLIMPDLIFFSNLFHFTTHSYFFSIKPSARSTRYMKLM